MLDSFKRAEKMLLRTIDSLPHPCYLVTPQGKIIHMNQPGLEVVSMSSEEDKGNNFFDLVYASQRELVEDTFKYVLRVKNSQTVELLIKNPLDTEESFVEDKQCEQHGTKYTKAVSTYKGYNHFTTTFKRFPLNTSTCILIICNNIEKHKKPFSYLINSGNQLKSQLRNVQFPAKTKTPVRDMQVELEKNRYRIKLIEYINERSLLLYEKSLSGFKSKKEGFNLTHLLIYLIEILFSSAAEKRIEFKLTMSLGTSEVIGEKRKLEVILLTFLSYFVEHSEEETISVVVGRSGERVRFEIACTTLNEYTEYEYLNKVIFHSKSKEHFAQYGLCTEVIAWMKGEIKLAEGGKGMVIEVPLAEYDKSLSLATLPAVEAPQFSRIGSEVYAWLWNRGECGKFEVVREESGPSGGLSNEVLEDLKEMKAIVPVSDKLVQEDLKPTEKEIIARKIEAIIELKQNKAQALKNVEKIPQKVPEKIANEKKVLEKDQSQEKAVDERRTTEDKTTPGKEEVKVRKGFFGEMRKLRDRNEVEAMSNINDAVIFNRIIAAGGKNPELEDRKPEDPKVLEERKKMQQELNSKVHMDKIFSVQKGKIKKRLSEKELKNVLSKEEMKKLRNNMTKDTCLE